MLFGLLFAVAPLWGDALAVGCAPASTAACCDATCADCTCCVEKSRPPGAPLNDTSLPPRPAESLMAIPAPAAAWQLPPAPAPDCLFSVRTSSAAARLPLFLRHCRLLI